MELRIGVVEQEERFSADASVGNEHAKHSEDHDACRDVPQTQLASVIIHVPYSRIGDEESAGDFVSEYQIQCFQVIGRGDTQIRDSPVPEGEGYRMRNGFGMTVDVNLVIIHDARQQVIYGDHRRVSGTDVPEMSHAVECRFDPLLNEVGIGLIGIGVYEHAVYRLQDCALARVVGPV